MSWVGAEPETVDEFMAVVVAERDVVLEFMVTSWQSQKVSQNTWYGCRKA